MELWGHYRPPEFSWHPQYVICMPRDFYHCSINCSLFCVLGPMRGKALLTTEPENEILILRLQKTQLQHKMQIGRAQDVIHVCVCASKHAAWCMWAYSVHVFAEMAPGCMWMVLVPWRLFIFHGYTSLEMLWFMSCKGTMELTGSFERKLKWSSDNSTVKVHHLFLLPLWRLCFRQRLFCSRIMQKLPNRFPWRLAEGCTTGQGGTH